MSERLYLFILLFFLYPSRGMAVFDLQSTLIQDIAFNEEKKNLSPISTFNNSKGKHYRKIKTLKRKTTRHSLGAKKPLSTLSLIIGIIEVGILVISGFDILAILIAGIIALAALIFGIIGIRKEGRGVGAIGMFLGGLGLLLGLLVLVGQLMG